MTYELDAGNRDTEDLFLAYKEQQIAIRQSVVRLWYAAQGALAQFDALEQRLVSGDLAPLVAYHTAKASQLSGAEQALYSSIGDLSALIISLESSVPGLFPGIGQSEEEEDALT